MEPSRSSNAAAFALLPIFPLVYLVLTALGLSTDAATKWTQAAVAVAAAVLVTMRSRSFARQDDDRGAVPKVLLRFVLLTVTVHLSVSVVAGVVGGFEPAQASEQQAEVFNDRMNMVIGMPLALLIIYGLGVWSVRLLPANKALLWLAAVSIASRAIALSLYPVLLAFSQRYDVPVPGIGEALVLHGLHGVLMFCFLALGNLRARSGIIAAPLGKAAPDVIAKYDRR